MFNDSKVDNSINLADLYESLQDQLPISVERITWFEFGIPFPVVK